MSGAVDIDQRHGHVFENDGDRIIIVEYAVRGNEILVLNLSKGLHFVVGL